ncbi:HAD family hydrolase [Salinibius halmophilus]|uniref:HAD family hydrolase n=1 Tax=Salinibius halmophilus TaxID=1853216 RepID=UPI000E66D8AC|nr:HAD-IA family hydrolase [Salinibius halmophilus]
MRGVLFDLDGTLIDSSAGFCNAVNDVLSELSLPPVDLTWVSHRLSGGARGLLADYFATTPDSEQVTQLRQRFLEHYLAKHVTTSVQAYAGIEQVLAWLDQRDIPWGIVTNKPEMLTTPTLEFLNWQARSHVTICPDHVQQVKPDPEGIRLACRALALTPEQIIYVGDHRKDVQAAHNAGSRAIACAWGFYPPSDAPELWQANWIARQPTDLIKIFAEQAHNATLA